MPPSFPLICTLCLLFFAATATPTDVWHVSILEAPAPPPGQGAPIQASALRNTAYLPAQIAAIVASYVLSVLFIGTALLSVGRRLRRAARESPHTLAMEMMKPIKSEQRDVAQAFDPSPISPATSQNLYGPSPDDTIDMKQGWPSPMKSGRGSNTWGSITGGHTKNQPSVQSSVVTFDENVIEDDKERNQKEMERLYAAVMEHDEKKSESVTDFGLVQQPQSPRNPGGYPPELQHLRNTQQISTLPLRSNTISPSRSLTTSPRSSKKPTPLSIDSRNSSRSSFGSFGKKRGIRNLPISPPMGSPSLVPDQTYDEREPLSPRIYVDPGPPPPTPPQMRAYNTRDDRLSPLDARFPEPSLRSPRTAIPAVPTVGSIPEAYQADVQLMGRERSALPSRDSNKSKRAPPPLALRTQAVSNSSSQHPLRSAPLPLRNPHPTSYNANPPDTIKATVLERKAPKQSSLRTPRTGVPMTPYSPYMPFTPLTPMTPSRLVTRQERKKREKEEGRKVVTVEDAVLEEPDAWGDAYP